MGIKETASKKKFLMMKNQEIRDYHIEGVRERDVGLR